MADRKKSHVSEAKKAKVKSLSEKMKSKTVMIVSIKGLPSAQFQDIKKKIRDKADIVVSKKSLVDLALEESSIKKLHDLIPYVDDSTAILFSSDDAFEISGLLADQKSPAKAKPGQIALSDIEVKAGPTDLIPGPDISALSAAGLTPKVEGGKIAIVKDKVIVKEGNVISAQMAALMAKLGIIPFEIGIYPIAAYMDGKIYVDIKIDKPALIAELEQAYSKALPFAIELSYVAPETLDLILAKASLHEKAIHAELTKSEVISG